jgi:hypothetical protein
MELKKAEPGLKAVALASKRQPLNRIIQEEAGSLLQICRSGNFLGGAMRAEQKAGRCILAKIQRPSQRRSSRGKDQRRLSLPVCQPVAL